MIELRELEGSAALLRICDDGVGIPDSVRSETAQTFGMQLITTLTEQLHGTLEILKHGGTDVRICFSCE